MQYQPTNETTQNFDASIPTPWTFMKKKPGKGKCMKYKLFIRTKNKLTFIQSLTYNKSTYNT